jgi:hypothetical protein
LNNTKFAEIFFTMDLNSRINAFVKLGENIASLMQDKNKFIDNLAMHVSNDWYTRSNLLFCLESISQNLQHEKLNEWIQKYPELYNLQCNSKIGLVTAGNIPLVGFHDVLCILLSGHSLIIKHSTKDEKLMTWLLELLTEIQPGFSQNMSIENSHLKGFDAVIATGGNNTANYFDYYFRKYPHIIRKNRNSLAILTGKETDEELRLLADDMLLYFGLGCRNVSKLFISEDFDIQRIFNALYSYADLVNHNKFANNYTYNKSIYMMNSIPFFENGFLILKEDTGIGSPVAVVFYERYSDIFSVQQKIAFEKEKIQCVVAHDGIINGSIKFGKSQMPELHDYADNIDTMEFLIRLAKD